MAQDRGFPAPVFKATDAVETECTDAGVTTAKGNAALADKAFTDENAKVVITAKAIVDALATQVTDVKALNTERDATVNKDLRAKDLQYDQAELDAQVLLHSAIVASDAAIVRAKELLDAKTAASTADSAAEVIVNAATKAETAATAHVTDEENLVKAAVDTMNAAMVAWKGGMSPTPTAGTGAIDTGKTASNEIAKFGAEVSAKAALATAVGTCKSKVGAAAASTADLAIGGTCATATVSSVETKRAPGGLAKFAMRKKEATDAIQVSKNRRETYLDAFCRAAQTLGAPDADIKAGKEYYSRANPGVRTDFLFTAKVGADSDTGTSGRFSNVAYANFGVTGGWMFEDLGARMAATEFKLDGHATVVATGQMTDDCAGGKTNCAMWDLLKCLAADTTSPAVAYNAAGVMTGNTGKAGRIYGTASGLQTSGIAASVTGLLDAGITAAATHKLTSNLPSTSGSKLEDKFAIWKEKALLSMTAYKTMIDTDTTLGAITGKKCHSDVTIAVPTVLAEVAAKASVTRNAKRPTNLITALVDGDCDTTANCKTKCATECKKLPSFGLATDAGTQIAGQKPQTAAEVC